MTSSITRAPAPFASRHYEHWNPGVIQSAGRDTAQQRTLEPAGGTRAHDQGIGFLIRRGVKQRVKRNAKPDVRRCVPAGSGMRCADSVSASSTRLAATRRAGRIDREAPKATAALARDGSGQGNTAAVASAAHAEGEPSVAARIRNVRVIVAILAVDCQRSEGHNSPAQRRIAARVKCALVRADTALRSRGSGASRRSALPSRLTAPPATLAAPCRREPESKFFPSRYSLRTGRPK